MKAFKLETQNSDISSRITSSLELISQVFRVNLWEIQKEYKVSPIQTQILIFLKFHDEKLCTVTELAKEFHLTKATVSDSIKTLVKKDFVEKVSDPEDSRKAFLSLTKTGKHLTENFDSYAKELHQAISTIADENKAIIYENLLSIISQLQNANIINERRMCISCHYYQEIDEESYRCNLMEKDLSRTELRLDCSEFESKHI